jgi:hypothetical protein
MYETKVTSRRLYFCKLCRDAEAQRSVHGCKRSGSSESIEGSGRGQIKVLSQYLLEGSDEKKHFPSTWQDRYSSPSPFSENRKE